MEKHLEMVSMMLGEGALEILEAAKDRKPKSFTELRQGLVNPRTKDAFSKTTLSMRLKELVEAGAMEKAMMTTKKGRDVIGYRVTPAGLRALDLAYEFEEKLKKVLRERRK